MKQLSLGFLALSLVAAGAQSTPYYDPNALDYTLNGRFLVNPPTVVSVAGLPTPVLFALEPMLEGAKKNLPAIG